MNRSFEPMAASPRRPQSLPSTAALGTALLLAGLLIGSAPGATVFSDNFSGGSTVPLTTAPANSYPATTATSTGYVIVSSKSQASTPVVTPGHLEFGIAATGSGIEQAQARFTTTPVTLLNTNDFIEFTISFVPTGILSAATTTSSGELDFGLFNSGGAAPHSDLSASGLTASSDPTGGAQGWVGYAVRLLPTTSSSKMDTRPAQTGVTNANQELLTAGASGSTSYAGAVPVGTSSTANVELTDGQPYTDDLVITLTGANQQTIVNNLYAGSTISGSPVSTFTKTASATAAGGSTFSTSTFDGMAFGWRETGVTGATVPSSMDVRSIAISTNANSPLPVPGDVDGNNVVNVADIQAMMAALADLKDYQGLPTVLDVNFDGAINNLDIQALISQIANASSGGSTLTAVPEPAAVLLLALGGVGLARTARRRSRAR